MPTNTEHAHERVRVNKRLHDEKSVEEICKIKKWSVSTIHYTSTISSTVHVRWPIAMSLKTVESTLQSKCGCGMKRTELGFGNAAGGGIYYLIIS